MEQPSKPTGKNREMILLVIVALIGAAGLLALQFARKSPPSSSSERSLVQSGTSADANPEVVSAPIQSIPGNLITRDAEYPEVGQPFTFRMANFSQGALYQLDMGDGSGRRTFKDGELRYTYKKSGEYQVTLYASFEGREVKLQTVTKKVVVSRQPERVEIVPIIEN